MIVPGHLRIVVVESHRVLSTLMLTWGSKTSIVMTLMDDMLGMIISH